LDVSISRYHCSFTKNKSKLLIYDLGSKYGSLIKSTYPIQIIPNRITHIQINNK